jgi:hypothetical protein
MKSSDRKTLGFIAGISGALGILLAIIALFIRKKDFFVSITVVLLIVSSVLYAVAVIDGYNQQGDFNSAVRLASPGATDDQYRCANNIVAASVMDLLSEPGLNNVYNWAVDQAKAGAKCDEGVLDTYGLCSGTAGTCKTGFAKKSACLAGCKFVSLKDGIKALLIALMQGGGGGPGTLNGACLPGLGRPDAQPFCPPPLTCNKQGVCVE